MKKIIEEVKDDNPTYEVRCRKCETKFSYQNEDIETEKEHRYETTMHHYEDTEWDEITTFVTCPKCGYKQILRSRRENERYARR